MQQGIEEARLEAAAGAAWGSAVAGRWRIATTVALLLLLGIDLRAVILGVPPILPLVGRDLRLDHTAAGLLTALPVLVFGALALPSGVLAGRIGGRSSVALGLALLTAGALLRVVWPAALPLYAFTALLSLGIAVAQTAAPVLVRQWFPGHVGLMAALFTDGLIVGETIAAGATVPLMDALFGSDGWHGALLIWSVPVVATLALWLLLAPAAPATTPRREPGAALAAVPAAQEPPRRVSALHMGALLGCGSLMYFGMNGWIASYDQARHLTALTPGALLALNAAQLPVSFGVTLVAQRIAGRGAPFIAAGCVCIVALAGWLGTPAGLEPLWAALLGGGSALIFTLGIALPPLLARQHEVARVTGITLGVSYSCAFLGPLLGGVLWDLVPPLPGIAFAPVGLAAVSAVVLGALLPGQPVAPRVGDEAVPVQRIE